jgi:hypothetical protein
MILEATYADPVTAEPPGWQDLRGSMEEKKARMTRLALDATRVWNNPSLEDEEGVQTRYVSYPTARLLMARDVAALDSRRTRINLLNGDHIEVREDDWDLDAAKAIYRNLAAVPLWAVQDGIETAPPSLEPYASRAAAGLVQGDGHIRWCGNEQDAGLSYDTDLGIVIHQDSVPRRSHEDSDESDD